jgi:hypothetical protein
MRVDRATLLPLLPALALAATLAACSSASLSSVDADAGADAGDLATTEAEAEAGAEATVEADEPDDAEAPVDLPADAPAEADAAPATAACNPLAPGWDCLLPFPSDVFRVQDPSLPGGHRVALPEAGLPHRESDGVAVDFLKDRPVDGFSHLPQILALFPGGIDPGNLVFHTGDVTRSLDASSPTLLVDASAAETVLHFAELDPRAATDDRRALVIRPMTRLKNSTRHVVAIHGLKNRDGKPVEPPEGFRRIRDGLAGDDPALAPLAQRYDVEVFPLLEGLGVARHELQLAWDFTTVSFANVAGDLLRARGLAIEAFEKDPPAVTITSVTEPLDGTIQRRIDGTIRVPLYLESTDFGAALHRGPDGRVEQNGNAEAPFLILVPRTVLEAGPDQGPARVVQYGHGFLGNYDNLGELALLYSLIGPGRIVLATVPWWGMTRDDVPTLLDDLAFHTSDTFRFTDHLHQAMVNAIALSYALRGPLAEEPSLRRDGAPLYDPTFVGFYGISQGHILGGTYAALAPLVDHVVLGSGGAGLSFIMPRSWNFLPFLLAIEGLVKDPADVQKFMSISQGVLDRIDPITYAPFVLSDTLAASPPRRSVLMQIGIGDCQVPNLSAHLHARAMGLKHLAPAPRPIAGLAGSTAPIASALVEFDFHVDPLPGIEASPPPTESTVHGAVRQLPAGVAQVDAFLRPGGAVEQTCDGPCDPE